jgi:hypothetical protein
MSRTITFKISGNGPDLTDAPTADDLLDQVRDYLEIFKGVEASIAEDGKSAIEWRVVNASKNSPIQIQIESYPREYAVNVDNRVEIVTRAVAMGLADLIARPERPDNFTDSVLGRAEKTFARVTNGLNLSEVDFGPGIAPVSVNRAVALSALKNTRLAISPAERNYQELGSIEGYFSKVERDGFNRDLLWIRVRRNGTTVKCILTGDALSIVAKHTIGEVLSGHRLLVSGVIKYKALGVISQVEASNIKFFRPKEDAVSIDSILDEDFTGGLTSEEYLEFLRNGNVH